MSLSSSLESCPDFLVQRVIFAKSDLACFWSSTSDISNLIKRRMISALLIFVIVQETIACVLLIVFLPFIPSSFQLVGYYNQNLQVELFFHQVPLCKNVVLPEQHL